MLMVTSAFLILLTRMTDAETGAGLLHYVSRLLLLRCYQSVEKRNKPHTFFLHYNRADDRSQPLPLTD